MSETHPDSKSAFFVGYLKMPKSLALFYWAVIPVAIGLMFGAGFGFAEAQRDPGSGMFTPPPQTLTGYFDLEPYPVLRTLPTESFPESRTILLTGAGKFGILPQAEKFAGKLVDVYGAFLMRGKQEIFQVGGRSVKLTKLDVTPEMAAFSAAPAEQLGRYRLKGEIVDGKCYLGAMLPGDGKSHMTCAKICMLGGVPPLFVIVDENGVADILLLADEQGKSVAGRVTDFTSLFVSVEGEVERRGDMKVFRVDPASIEIL